MPRVYVRRRGVRPYKNYTEESLEKAISEIRNKQISFRAAAEKYGIHRNTLLSKVHEKHKKNTGGQTVFKQEEEEAFVAHIIAMATYGFPMTNLDLRMTIKNYLDKQGKIIAKFNDNTPGIDGCKSFLNRHKNLLSSRYARNITHSRASIDKDIVDVFFNNIKRELVGVPASNVWNFDETNLVDDPGSKKVLVKRGTKYPEKIRNSTKACTSIMMCGSAEGVMAPIYVNYKSENMWHTWTEGGPPNTRYNRTKSGWFDSQSFEDWFTYLLLPILKKLPGKKVLIGDNLSSHINLEVVRLCNENNISFIALPPNATHLLQPLDVAYFRSMKREWRNVLDQWKDTSYGSKCSSIPKDQFPKLIKKLMESLAKKESDNLKAGFRKCGLVPLDSNVVHERLSDNIMQSVLENNIGMSERISDTFLQELKKRRHDEVGSKRQRRKKINITPGKGITQEDLQENPGLLTSCLTETSEKSTSNKKNKQKKDESSSESEMDEFEYDEGECSLGSLLNEGDSSCDDENDYRNIELDVVSNRNKFDCINLNVGDFVAFRYETKVYPGQVTGIDDNEVKVNAMVKTGKYWKWPPRRDEIWYPRTSILRSINNPKQISKTREIFFVNMKP